MAAGPMGVGSCVHTNSPCFCPATIHVLVPHWVTLKELLTHQWARWLYWQYSGEGWGRDAGVYIAVLTCVGHDRKQLLISPLGFLPSKVPVWLGFKDFLRCPLPHTSLQCCSPLCPLGTWNSLLFWVSRAIRLCPSTSAQTYPIKRIIGRHLQLDSFDVSRGGFPEGHQRNLQLPIPLLSTYRSFI